MVNVIKSGNYEECGSWRTTKLIMKINVLIEKTREGNMEAHYISKDAVQNAHQLANLVPGSDFIYNGLSSEELNRHLNLQ
jgi:hypothetical protein